MNEVTVHHLGLSTDRIYIHIAVEGGPHAGIWEIRYEPEEGSLVPGPKEPGKWVVMLPDGGVHFAQAEDPVAATLRPALEELLGPEIAAEVFQQFPSEWQ